MNKLIFVFALLAVTTCRPEPVTTPYSLKTNVPLPCTIPFVTSFQKTA